MTCYYCDRREYSDQMCERHYFRWRKYGDPLAKYVRSIIRKPLEATRAERRAATIEALKKVLDREA